MTTPTPPTPGDEHAAPRERLRESLDDHGAAFANSDRPGDFVCDCGLPWLAGQGCAFVRGYEQGTAQIDAALAEQREQMAKALLAEWGACIVERVTYEHAADIVKGAGVA